jgi:hypothetical protein
MMHRLAVKKKRHSLSVATKKTEQKSIASPHQNTWKVFILSNCRSTIQIIDNANILEVIRMPKYESMICNQTRCKYKLDYDLIDSNRSLCAHLSCPTDVLSRDNMVNS